MKYNNPHYKAPAIRVVSMQNGDLMQQLGIGSGPSDSSELLLMPSGEDSPWVNEGENGEEVTDRKPVVTQ